MDNVENDNAENEKCDCKDVEKPTTTELFVDGDHSQSNAETADPDDEAATSSSKGATTDVTSEKKDEAPREIEKSAETVSAANRIQLGYKRYLARKRYVRKMAGMVLKFYQHRRAIRRGDLVTSADFSRPRTSRQDEARPVSNSSSSAGEGPSNNRNDIIQLFSANTTPDNQENRTDEDEDAANDFLNKVD